MEKRKLTSTTALNDYLDWPGVKQVFKLERQRTIKAQTSFEVTYGITSLSRKQANAEQLLEIMRGHWQIENGVHHSLDVSFCEDACRVHMGHGAELLSLLRKLALYLINTIDHDSKPAAQERFAAYYPAALALIE